MSATRDLSTLSLAELKREDERILNTKFKTPEARTRRLRAVRIEVDIREKDREYDLKVRALDLKEREIVLEERRFDEMARIKTEMASLVEHLQSDHGNDDDPFSGLMSSRVGRG